MIKNRNSLLNQRSFFRSKLLLVFLMALQFSVFGQGKQVTGTVSSESGETLPGVNVIVSGTTNGTITDFDGKFSINVPSNQSELKFSFVGYIDQVVAVSDRSVINVVLAETVTEVDEVVVVGYGTQKKSDITGSVASISAESLKKQPATRVDEALQGKAAGVMVLQNSGQPGASPVIRIRGLATVNGGNPLVVIDGIAGGSLSNLNPSDIESIEVLKDAASQGIYGSAGGNGVILVTTKKGKTGKLQTNFNMYTGVQSPWSTDQVKVANGQEYAAIYNKYKTSNGSAAHFPYDEATGQYLNPDTNQPLSSTDWVNEIFRTAIVQNYNLSLTGGNKVSTFFFSAGYSAEEGTLKRTSNDRWIIRLNSEHKLGKRIKVGQNLNITQNINQGQSERNEYGSPLSTSIQMLPFVPIYATDGSGNFAYRDAGLSSNIKNPLAQIEFNNNISRANSIFGNAFVRAEIIKGLSFESRIGGNYNPSSYIGFTPKHDMGNIDNISPSQSQPASSINYNVNMSYGWQWQNYLTYITTIAEKHNLNVVLGTEAGYGYYDYTNRNAIGHEFDEASWSSFSDTTGLMIMQNKKVESSGYAYFGRFTYDYDGIYLLQANFRRDYSSKFGPNNRVGNFPSISVGVKFSEYDFIKNLGFIDFGKIRVGYGETGNSDIQPFLYLNSFGPVLMNSYAFGGVTREGASLLTAANPDLKWETVVTQNIGVDLRFLNSRLSISADAFARKNEDMLLRKSVPYTVGYYISDAGNELGDGNLDTRPLVNYGTLDNKGFEFSVDYKDQIGDLTFSVNANITRAITKIDDIGDPLYAGTGRGLSNICQTKNGEAVSTFYGYKTNGVYQEDEFTWYLTKTKKWARAAQVPNGATVIEGVGVDGNPITIQTNTANAKPGNYRFVDSNGDNVISPLDMVAIGDPNPDFTFGFGSNLEYKGFDLNLFFQGSYGNDIYNMLKVNLYNINNGGLNVAPDMINAYIPSLWESKDKNVAPVKLTEAENTTTGNFRMDGDLASSDFYVEDGSYLRLKNIQLGYSVPASVLKKVKISNLRIYVGAKNLFTFTKYTGFDPEVGETSLLERGFDRGTYPQSKLYTLGVNLSF